jgi:hypothetical protein
MNRGPAITMTCAALAAAALLAGCGSDDEEPTGAQPQPRETVEELPDLPDGWRKAVNRPSGFVVGVPPGWDARMAEGAQGSLLRTPDDLVVVSISADRTGGALELPLEEFATRTAEALGGEVAGEGRLRNLELGELRELRHRYDAVALTATGTAARGVRERILVAVIRREGLATYVVVARENARRASQFGDLGTVERIARTLRGRPPA